VELESYRLLTSVTIPSSVRSIGEGAFSGMALSTVYVTEGDMACVKSVIRNSGYDVRRITFVVAPDKGAFSSRTAAP